MIFDAESREDGWFRDRVFDVCIVGSGPAGITLARALARRGREVGLFEGGGRGPTPDSQDLYAGEVIGGRYSPLDQTRLRYFGGASNHWNGWTRQLDAWDFLPHPSNPHSGWPIGKADLDPFAAETDEILDLRPEPAPAFGTDLSPLEPIAFTFSPPTRFRRKYGRELHQARTLRLYLNANLVGIGLDESRRRVTELRFKSFQREDDFAVRGRCFVLCLGGIENPRALLNTPGGGQHALGNEHDLVGRNFCEHLHYGLGSILFKQPLGLYHLGPKPAFLDSARINTFGLRLVQDSLTPVQEAQCTSPDARKVAEVIGALPECAVSGQLRIASEQALNPESRVRLIDAVDRFGWRRVALDWRLSDVDLRTVRTAALEAGKVFAKHDLGRIKLLPWVVDEGAAPPKIGEDEVIGCHHMCTTRMSADPRHGVVDADCRLHAVENLYLGGSSVFATAGHSNPTYTIVQLALRLGEHLHSRLG